VYILALADDMTGALETGAKFSAAGIETIVSAKPVEMNRAVALVLDTETRHLDAGTAGREVQRFVRAGSTREPQLIYKKTDSTLRGNISAELRALAQLYPDWTIGYAPSYPALGRTVKAGDLYVHGRPVSETEFAADELNPIGSSSIRAMLGRDFACTVFDGETDAHLAQSAQAILSDPKMRIAVGPAGLAQMLAAKVDVPRKNPACLPRVRTCLVINGSRHKSSVAQMQGFTAAGWQVVHAVLEPGLDAAQVARANGSFLLAQLALQKPDAIFVIGGDTAFAVVRELGFPNMVSIAEVVPGVPVTHIAAADLRQALPGRQEDLILITKAGAFGGPDVLSRVHAQLSGDYGR